MTHPDYKTVFNYAAQRATALQVDMGIEKRYEFGRFIYTAKLLPKPEHRYGHELNCEVVSPGTPLLA